MFLVLVNYTKPLETIDKYLAEHRSFLEEGDKNNFFVVSGPREPRTGGIIISQLKDRSKLEEILSKDPFQVYDVANYEIIEFTPTKYHQNFLMFISNDKNTKYFGECFCGTVKFFCYADPFFTQHCHCNKCREIASLSKRESDKLGYGFTAGYLKSNFHITSGSDNLDEVVRNNSKLLLCKSCHSLIYGISLDLEKQAGIGVNANNFQFTSAIPDSFKPVRHIWYINRIVNFDDNLPKFKDSPKEQFGSGELCD